MQYVRLLSKSNKPLSIHYPDEGIDITWQPSGQPGSVVDLPEEAANFCLQHFGPLLEVLKPEVQSLAKEEQREYWLANMTGDPDAWDERPAEVWDRNAHGGKGALVMSTVKNGNKQPSTFVSYVGRVNDINKGHFVYINGQIQRQTDPDFNQSVTLPGKRLEIKPYERRQVTKTQFEVLLQRDSEQSIEYASKILESRPPSDFEPDFYDPEYWTSSKMQTWLEMTPNADGRKAGKHILGPTEAELEKETEGLGPTAKGQRLAAARYDLWTRCFFRMANPKVRLPTRKEFEAAVARKAKAAKSEVRAQ